MVVGACRDLCWQGGQFLRLARRREWCCWVIAEASEPAEVLPLLTQPYACVQVVYAERPVMDVDDSGTNRPLAFDPVRPEYLASVHEIEALLGAEDED